MADTETGAAIERANAQPEDTREFDPDVPHYRNDGSIFYPYRDDIPEVEDVDDLDLSGLGADDDDDVTGAGD